MKIKNFGFMTIQYNGIGLGVKIGWDLDELHIYLLVTIPFIMFQFDYDTEKYIY